MESPGIHCNASIISLGLKSKIYSTIYYEAYTVMVYITVYSFMLQRWCFWMVNHWYGSYGALVLQGLI